MFQIERWMDTVQLLAMTGPGVLKSPVIMTMLTILDPDEDRRFLVNFDFHPVIVRVRRLFFPYSFFLFPDLSSVSIFFPGHEAVQPTICSISLSTLNAIFVRL